MGVRKWFGRPMRGHHLGVEDLTRGDEGVPVRALCFRKHQHSLPHHFDVSTIVLIRAGYKASPMGTSDNRFGSISGLGRRRSRYWLLDRLIRPLLSECCHANDRLCLLVAYRRQPNSGFVKNCVDVFHTGRHYGWSSSVRFCC